jgi:hypothetical protein
VKTATCVLLTALAALLLAACGGGSAPASSAPATVTGIATPTSVSVVTAN